MDPDPNLFPAPNVDEDSDLAKRSYRDLVFFINQIWMPRKEGSGSVSNLDQEPIFTIGSGSSKFGDSDPYQVNIL